MAKHHPHLRIGAALIWSALASTLCWAEPPTNDACTAALDHEINPFGGTVTGTVVEATNDGTGCGSNRLPGSDVYHSFIPATRGPWRFDLCETAAGWDTVISLHRDPINPLAVACPTTPFNRIAGGCDDDGCNAFFGQVPSIISAVSLEPGVRYTVRIGGFDGNSTTDTYQLVVTDLNIPQDDCSGADQAPIGGGGDTVFGDLSDATTDGSVNAATCLGSNRSGSVRDVYHLFTPATSGRWTISTCISGVTWPADTVVSVHTGCPATAANAIACNNDGCEDRIGASVISVNLVAGTTYRIRVAEFLRDRFDAQLGIPQYALSVTSEPTGSCCSVTRGTCEVIPQSMCAGGNPFTLGATCAPLVPGGTGSCAVGTFDQCAQAIALPFDELVNVSTAGLTGTAISSCHPFAADGWFTFTAPVSATYQLFAQPILTQLGLAATIYPGLACPTSSATELECGFIFGDGARFNLDAGASVTIRLAATTLGRLGIRVSLSAEVPPANDLCPLAAAVIRDVPVSGSFTGAAGTLSVETCSSGQRDVWYTYTAPSTTRTRITSTPVPGNFMTTALSVSTTCATAQTPIACAGEPGEFDAPTVLLFNATAGVTYRIRVSTNSELGNFNLLVDNAPAAPANDACASATALTLDAPASGTTRFASGSAGAISFATCSSPSTPDVWFSFRPTVSGPLEVTATPDTSGDASVSIGVFLGCPSNAASDLTCSGAFGTGFPNTVRFLATANTDYLIRASSYSGVGDFSIVVATSTAPLGACCLRDGGCQVTSPDDCNFSGSYSGDNTACENAGCAPAGRCCFSGSSSCTITSQSQCTGPGTTFTADESCFPTECAAGITPANDLCQNAPTLTLPATVVTGIDLADAEGPSIPAGFCSTSQSFDLGLDRSVYYRFVPASTSTLHFDVQFMNYPEPIVVLYRGNTCGQLLDVDCTFRFQAPERKSFEVEGGQTYYLGLGIRNDPNFFNVGGLIGFILSLESSSGACCRGSVCSIEDAASCGGGGVFQGGGTACGAPGNPTTCCPANFNGMGGVTVQDIFDFLSAYFTSNNAADFNGSGSVTVQDIFDFLSAYFTGCA